MYVYYSRLAGLSSGSFFAAAKTFPCFIVNSTPHPMLCDDGVSSAWQEENAPDDLVGPGGIAAPRVALADQQRPHGGRVGRLRPGVGGAGPGPLRRPAPSRRRDVSDARHRAPPAIAPSRRRVAAVRSAGRRRDVDHETAYENESSRSGAASGRSVAAVANTVVSATVGAEVNGGHAARAGHLDRISPAPGGAIPRCGRTAPANGQGWHANERP